MIDTKRIVAAGGAGALTAVALGLLVHGAGVEGWSAATRWTARWALIPFALVFATPGLLPRTRGWLRSLLRNRRGLGLAFALAHFVHAGAILAFFAVSGERPAPIVLLGGGLAYLFILAMALTSTDAAQRALGRGWKHLHRWGLWYVFLIFAQSYAGRLARMGEHAPEGAFGVAVLALALALRLLPRRQPAYLTEQP
jgi:DMSO/TMAO reductase YedYZ heme-binding membrane subunit